MWATNTSRPMLTTVCFEFWSEKKPVPADLHLSIDAGLQAVAEAALGVEAAPWWLLTR